MVVLIGTLAAVFALDSYIDYKVDRKLQDEALLQKVASYVRPALIFDTEGRVLFDMGAWQYLQGIDVQRSKNPLVPEKVVITPKNYLRNPPLLTTVEMWQFNIKSSRGKGITWEYTFERGVFLPFITEGREQQPPRFRLEIVP